MASFLLAEYICLYTLYRYTFQTTQESDVRRSEPYQTASGLVE